MTVETSDDLPQFCETGPSGSKVQVPEMRTGAILRVVALVAAGFLLLLALVAVWAWRSPPFYTRVAPGPLAAPIMTMEEYSKVSAEHPRPYVVEIESADGAVLVYGASHTRNPRDPQIADIRRRWDAFRPTVALVEGRLGFLLPGIMDPVRQYGEMGAVNDLARRSGVRVYSWEPPREVEFARMLERFPAKRVALFYVLRPYFSNLRHGRPADPDAYVEEYRRKRTAYPGLTNTLWNVADIDSIWKQDFPGLPDWRDTSDEYGLPGYLGGISAASNGVRDEHLVNVLLDLAGHGARVFAITGSSHSVKVEAALRATLETRAVTSREPAAAVAPLL